MKRNFNGGVNLISKINIKCEKCYEGNKGLRNGKPYGWLSFDKVVEEEFFRSI